MLSYAERSVLLKACIHWHGNGWNMVAAVVMPEHFHLIAWPENHISPSPSMAELMKSIKGLSAREINKLRKVHGNLWQPDYHDEILENEQALRKAVDYLLANPVKRKLASRPEEYLFEWTYWHGFYDCSQAEQNATGKSRPRPF